VSAPGRIRTSDSRFRNAPPRFLCRPGAFTNSAYLQGFRCFWYFRIPTQFGSVPARLQYGCSNSQVYKTQNRASRSLDPVDEALGGFAPILDPAAELQNLHTYYEWLLRQAEDFQQPVGNRVRQEEDRYTNARVVTTVATTACICSLRDQLRRTSTKIPLLADA